MKKYTEIYENIITSDILIIVDVQKEFDKFIPHLMVKKLFNYCKKFKEVYQIWDIKGLKPTYKFPNEVQSIEKKYLIDKDVKHVIDKIENKQSFKEGDKISIDNYIIVKIDNNHQWFVVNKELSELFKKLANKNVVIVGGGDNECLADIYESAKSFGIIPTYNHEYIYSNITKK